MTYPSSYSVTYQNDGLNRRTRVSSGPGALVDYGYQGPYLISRKSLYGPGPSPVLDGGLNAELIGEEPGLDLGAQVGDDVERLAGGEVGGDLGGDVKPHGAQDRGGVLAPGYATGHDANPRPEHRLALP